ncbi:MAG: hypothetical protein EYC68_10610 [Chloroflexota bacterium]|nr:MAG: hypothetical protein EYC68_10610 [Chloroflexota bacterium]
MERLLTLQIPEEIYKPLVQTAEQEGVEPETLAIEWLSVGMQQVLHDPIEDFIGAFPSQVPDWVEKHDQYVGESLFQEMKKAME